MTEDNKDSNLEEQQEQEFQEREADLEKLNDPEYILEQAQKEAEENKQNYLRALADLENFKKRTIKERSELLKYQGERIIFDFIEILDTLDMALEQQDSSPEDLQKGLEMIHKQFLEVFEKWSVKATSNLGLQFDPQVQEAVSTIIDAESKPGIVLKELKKAYHYKDKLVRAGQVIVTKEPESGDGEEE